MIRHLPLRITVISVAAGALMFAIGAVLPAAAQGAYVSPSSSSDASVYTYHNRFPADVSTFPTTKEVGGGVFVPGPKAGDAFPMNVTVYDEHNKPHKFSDLVKPGKPLVVVLVLTAAPQVMKQLVRFQKSVDKLDSHPDIILVNVAQFGSKLQPNTLQSNNGRTLKLVSKRYGLSLPFYWLKNDIYSPQGFTNRLHARSLPAYYVIDDKGEIRKIFNSSKTKWSAANFRVTG